MDALIETWRQATFEPTLFFRRMPREFDYGAVIAYYLVIGVVASGIQLFWEMVLPPWGLRALLEGFAPAGASPAEGVIGFLLSPIFLLILLYVAAGLAHLVLLIFRGANHGFETTTRVFAFSYSPQLFVIVPFLGGLVGFVWMIAIAIIGLREAHVTSGGKAAAAVLIPLFFLISFVALALFAAMILKFQNVPM